MRLSEILSEIQYISVSGNTDPEINEVTNNTSEISAGDIFVCIKGFKTNGHKYISQAVENKAAAVVVSEDVGPLPVPIIKVNDTRLALSEISKAVYKDPSRELKIIGVTGTNGKTTVSYLIKSILETAGNTVGLIGTNETIVGQTRIPAMRTTPESHKLNKLFREMISMNVKYCVMEVSSHSLELYRVHGISFTAGVFTNLTHDHLDFHGTMENYFDAKAKLFSMSEISVINIDSPWGVKLAKRAEGHLITYSINNPSDNKAENVELFPGGNVFELGNRGYSMCIPGTFSVYNGLAAICTCRALGVPAHMIAEGLAISHGAKGRAELVEIPADFKVIIDYAHTPDGLYNILTTIKDFAPARIICVFGAAGERDSVKRPEMGEIVGKYADFAYITADNPINEDLTLICKQVEAGMKQTNCPYEIIYDRKIAIEKALNNASKDDIVLLAGKGHETYQLIGDDKVPFSETEIVQNFFINQEDK